MCGHRSQHRRPARIEPARALPADDLRASDAEREQAADDLRAHAAEGRLSADELDERLGVAYAAATRSQLAALVADLPRRRAPGGPTADPDLAGQVRAYVLVMIVLVAVWAVTGAGYFWPMWPALGWGIGLLAQAVGDGRRGPHVAQ